MLQPLVPLLVVMIDICYAVDSVNTARRAALYFIGTRNSAAREKDNSRLVQGWGWHAWRDRPVLEEAETVRVT